jgi:hypothetical protein
VDELNVVGEAHYDDSRCLVILTTPVKGHELLCGYPKESCRRPKHRVLQTLSGRRGMTGVYQQLPNGKGVVHDAVADTRRTVEEVEASRLQNLSLLEALRSSPEKALAELQAKPRSRPTVRIDTSTPATGPRKTRLQSWAKDLPETPTGPATAFATTTPYALPAPYTAPTTTAAPAGPTSRTATADPVMVSLLSKMVDKFDTMNAAQDDLLRENNRILTRLEYQDGQNRRQQQEIEELRRRAEDGQPTTRRPVPDTVSVPSRETTKSSRYYAVARGRQTGIFPTWEDTERQVKGYSGAKHKRFKSETAARKWLRSNGVNPDADDASEISADGDDSNTVIEPTRSTRTSSVPRSAPQTGAASAGAAHFHGPDQSVGSPDLIHRTSIHVESEILKILCPKGVTAATRKDLIEAAPDVLSLPGKLGSATTNTSDVWDQLAGAVGDMAEQRSNRAGIQPRDTQWRGATRNAMDKIKTIEDLYDAADELGSQADKVLQSFEASIQEILYSEGWARDNVDQYVSTGLLPRIVQRLLAIYYEIYLHFQRLVVQNPDPDHFKTYTMLHVEYHARQLRHIRMYAVRRSGMLLRSYTYLRDAKSKGFTNVKLIGAVTHKLQEMTSLISDAQLLDRAGGKKIKDWACTHCHSDLHEGGSNLCVLKDFKTKTARRIAKEAERKVKEEPGVLERLMKEELTKE